MSEAIYNYLVKKHKDIVDLGCNANILYNEAIEIYIKNSTIDGVFSLPYKVIECLDDFDFNLKSSEISCYEYHYGNTIKYYDVVIVCNLKQETIIDVERKHNLKVLINGM